MLFFTQQIKFFETKNKSKNKRKQPDDGVTILMEHPYKGRNYVNLNQEFRSSFPLRKRKKKAHLY